MTLRIEHGIQATVEAPVDAVWEILGDFERLDWYPQIESVTLVGGVPGQVGAIRQLNGTDGSQIRERVEALGQRRFTYSFDGPLPLPVQDSHFTVEATTGEDPSTTIVTWRGQFAVADADDAATVEHVNTQVVWPALIAARATRLGVAHALKGCGHTDDATRQL